VNRRVALLALLLVAAAGAWGASRLAGGGQGVVEQVVDLNRQNVERRRAELLARGEYVEDGHTRLGAARPAEWLFEHPEPGQTFEEHVASGPLRRTPGRERIVLQPLEPLRPEARAALEAVRQDCALFFGCETTLADPIPIPPETWREDRKQHDAEGILDALAARKPADALVYAAICDQDLFVRGLERFVFGLGRFSAGLGVYSFQRFHHPGVDPTLYVGRAFKLLTHEIGHGFGLRHCIYFRCVMNGANSLPEADGAPFEPCPVCLRKLQHGLGFDVRARWEALAPFFERQGLPAQAEWLRARAAALPAGAQGPWR
jgi:archaemetzincin